MFYVGGACRCTGWFCYFFFGFIAETHYYQWEEYTHWQWRKRRWVWINTSKFFRTITANRTFWTFSQTSQTAPGGEDRDPGWEPCLLSLGLRLLLANVQSQSHRKSETVTMSTSSHRPVSTIASWIKDRYIWFLLIVIYLIYENLHL